ncbi:DUF3857 domain-containing protein [Winogradskyella poriferorum]|uniref:DUF3857 domain-containing protein n=1 Tax=Winogradskyella poriferorum TaxID=307627 RepID=UPI003D648D80
MKLINLLCFLTLFLQTTHSQEVQTSALTIPNELKENANAVIRQNNTSITLLSDDKMVVSKKEIITILNQNGDLVLDTYLHYGDDTKINDISLRILDVNGNEIEKISKSKFIDINATDGFSLYNDDRVTYVDYTPNTYPYTAIFEYEYKTASTALIPTWYPIHSYNVAVENSSYSIHNPNNLKIRSKAANFENYNITKDTTNSINYTLKNQPAIKYESNSDYYFNILPNLLVSLESFTLRGVKGQAKDWRGFGQWMNNELLAGKTKLDETTIIKAKNLVKNAENNIEKAKILYTYMQNKTRYISVQVGIGGWQPVNASDVEKLAYGDCKGLTIYMKALLEAVGIPSYYSIVYAGNRRNIDSDFASIQGNHVILNIPNNENELWLECTSQTLPFGFLSDFTDDRDVLVITPNGGEIKRTPSYKNHTNLQVTHADIKLNKNGGLVADLERISTGIKYSNKYHLSSLNEDDLHKHYKTETWSYINNLDIIFSEAINDRDNVQFTEKLNLKVNDYATLNGKDYIFTVNFFNKNRYIPRRQRNRQLPFIIENGYKDEDNYIIEIPDGYEIGLLPETVEIKTKFGEYYRIFKKINNNKISCKITCSINQGNYPKENYNAYRLFRKQIAKQENLRLILKKSHQ